MVSASQMGNDLGGFFNCDTVNALPDSGRTFTITKYEPECKVGQEGDLKPVVFFAESKKGVVLSKGRVQQLGALFGTEDILGKRIRLNVAKVHGRDGIVFEGDEG